MLRSSLILILLCACSAFGATITSAGSGEWSSTGTWVGGAIPADGDAVVIATGHTVLLNADYSARTFTSVTVTGTLTLSSSATSYLKISGKLLGAGSLLCGSSATPLPVTRSATIEFSGTDSGIDDDNLTVLLYCYQPTLHIAYLTADWGSGTSVPVGSDLTEWGTLGYGTGLPVQVAICEKNGSKAGYTLFTATTCGNKTLEVSAFADAKTTGDIVMLMTRNIRLLQTNTSNTLDLIEDVKDNVCVIGAECVPDADRYVVDAETGVTFSGSAYGAHALLYGVDCCLVSGDVAGCTYNLLNTLGTLNGNTAGCSSAISASSFAFNGLVFGCGAAINQSFGSVQGIIDRCNYALSLSNCTVFHGTISNCTVALLRSSLTGYGGTLTGNATINAFYNCIPAQLSSMLYDYGGIAGAFYGFTMGGVVINDTATYSAGYGGYSVIYKHTKDTTSKICYRQIQTTIAPGETLTLRGIIKLGGDHTGYAPRLEIIDISSDPIIGGTALSTALVPTIDGTITDFQTITCSYKNTYIVPKTILLRASSSTPSQNIYESFIYSTSGGSGSWGSTSSGSNTSQFGGGSQF